MGRLMVGMAALVALSSPCCADDWFSFDRHAAIAKVRSAVDRIGGVAPLPDDLECRQPSGMLRYCTVAVSDGLKFEIVEVLPFPADGDIGNAVWSDFKNGVGGKVYEIASRVSSDARASEYKMFDVLCVASMLALRPKLSVADADRRYAQAFRRSLNKIRSKDSRIVLAGNPDTFVVETNDAAASCTVSAEDDYRLKQ